MKIITNRSRYSVSKRSIAAIILVCALIAGILLGHFGIVNMLQASWQNALLRWTAQNESQSIPLLIVDMPFENYNLILSQRQEALQKGFIASSETSFVTADLRFGAEIIPVRMQLQSGLAQHLGDDDKWNFEVVTRDNQQVLDQTRFNLIDPADNNWLWEWAYMEALRKEGLPAANYQFVRLFLNGDDRGIYAMQESFGSFFPGYDGRQSGPIVAYDVQPLLETAAYFGGDIEAAIADPSTNLTLNNPQFVGVDTNPDPLIADDEQLSTQMNQATAFLRALQRGDVAASEGFDVAQYGRFLALADLWGAAGTLSPLNLTYYFNPQSGRLEPLSMNGNPMATSGRISHEATYQDPLIQAAYIRATADFSDPDYLVELEKDLNPQLEQLEQALRAETSQSPIWPQLAQRQEQLRLSLQPAQPIIAYLDSSEWVQEGILQVKVANVLNLPLEVLGFNIDGATFLEADPAWIIAGQDYVALDGGKVILNAVPSGALGGLAFVSFNLPMQEIIKQDQELQFLSEIEITIATRIPGLEEKQLTPAGAGLPASLNNDTR
jgi:hypothetical protein